MNDWRTVCWRRGVALWLAVAVALAGCANPQQPRASASIVLAAIVVDGARLAGERETGLVRVWRNGRAIDGQTGMALLRGDVVETGANADAVIRYPNGSSLYMRPYSRGRVGSLSEAVGEFFARIKGVFSIESSFVRAAANGTAFLVRARDNGEMTVTVIEGEVFVDSTRGAWPRIAVGVGRTVVAQATASPPLPASEQELRRATEWVDRVDRLLPQATTGGVGSVGGAIAIGVAIAAAAALLSSRDKDSDSRRGRDSTDRTAQPSVVLTAPAGHGIGSTDANRPPAVTCTGQLMLSWAGVRGARDYLVTLQTRNSSRAAWATLLSKTSSGQSLEISAETGRSYRWWVQARDESRAGPASSTLYFNCRAAEPAHPR